MKKSSLAHYKVFPRCYDMMNMFMAAAKKYPDEFADKLDESLNFKIKRIVADIEKGMKRKEIRKLNARLAAIIIAGQLNYVCYFLSRKESGDIDPAEFIDQILDINFNGIKK